MYSPNQSLLGQLMNIKNPDTFYQRLMSTNPQFAKFVNANKGKSPVPGAVIERTTADGNQYEASITFLTRENCCLESQISAIVSGVPTIINTATVVSKRV